MIKNILFTMLQRKEAMEDVNKKSLRFFIISYLITSVLFYVIYYTIIPFFDYHLTRAKYAGLIGPRIAMKFVTDVLIAGFILLFFINSMDSSARKSVVKMVIAMNFPNPIFYIVNGILNNGLLSIMIFIYDIFFIRNYMKINIDNKKDSQASIIIRIIIAIFLAAFIKVKIFYIGIF